MRCLDRNGNRHLKKAAWHIYTDGSAPGSALSEAKIRRHLEAVSAFADTVRFYNAGGEINKAYRIAHDMGFSVVGTAYLGGTESENKAELDALIA